MIHSSSNLTSAPESLPEDSVDDSNYLDNLHVREVLAGLKHTTKDREERSVQALAQHTAFINILQPIIHQIATDSSDLTFHTLLSLWSKGQMSALRLARQLILPETTKEIVRTAVCINAWKCSIEVIRSALTVYKPIFVIHLAFHPDTAMAFSTMKICKRACGPGPHRRIRRRTNSSQGIPL